MDREQPNEERDVERDEGRDAPYCPAPAAPAGRVDGPPYADCLECGKPTEYGAATPGVVLCPVCEWQDAQRSACSG